MALPPWPSACISKQRKNRSYSQVCFIIANQSLLRFNMCLDGSLVIHTVLVCGSRCPVVAQLVLSVVPSTEASAPVSWHGIEPLPSASLLCVREASLWHLNIIIHTLHPAQMSLRLLVGLAWASAPDASYQEYPRPKSCRRLLMSRDRAGAEWKGGRAWASGSHLIS